MSQSEMAELRNPRHEHFCQLVAAGHSPTQAYVTAGYSEKTAYTSGPRLLKTPEVSARVTDLRQMVAQAAVNRAVIDRDWVLEGLRNIAEKGASESARVRALELCGKELGMFVDRSSFLWDTDPSQWTNEQVEIISEALLRKAAAGDPGKMEALRRQAAIEAGVVVIDAEPVPVTGFLS
jgi:hypothetical protein